MAPAHSASPFLLLVTSFPPNPTRKWRHSEKLSWASHRAELTLFLCRTACTSIRANPSVIPRVSSPLASEGCPLIPSQLFPVTPRVLIQGHFLVISTSPHQRTVYQVSVPRTTLLFILDFLFAVLGSSPLPPWAPCLCWFSRMKYGFSQSQTSLSELSYLIDFVTLNSVWANDVKYGSPRGQLLHDEPCIWL